jgi:hypothetical protein
MTTPFNPLLIPADIALYDEWGQYGAPDSSTHAYGHSSRVWRWEKCTNSTVHAHARCQWQAVLGTEASAAIVEGVTTTDPRIVLVFGAAARNARIHNEMDFNRAARSVWPNLVLPCILGNDNAQEVENLKQQVAFLTGIVNLRSEQAGDPLVNAKARGVSYMKSEFENPENLTLTAASEYAGRSDRIINQERNRGTLYALILEGNTRGYRYPKWQFDVPTTRLRPVLEVLIPTPMSCWALHSFLVRPNTSLDSKSPKDVIGDSGFPLERVVDAARRRADQQQGAS